MAHVDRTGLLLVNLGTPDSPERGDVRRYLRQFLSDPRVIDIAAWKRWLVLNLFILPFRPKASGEAYEQVWTDRGSPLLFHGIDLRDQVRRRLGDEVVVELAMRYGNPSIASAFDRFAEQDVRRIVVFPLYPHYASSSTGSSLEAIYEEAGRRWNVPSLAVVPPFYAHPAFIEARAALAAPWIEAHSPEHLFFSFHGLPERHVTKSDLTGGHCLESPGCCDQIVAANADCYRAQCFATARLLAERLGLEDGRWEVCFQSRLGRDPWIRPYTDERIVEVAESGVKRAMILSPAFVADCLETLEELGLRAAEDFEKHGGEELVLVPSLNATDVWSDTVVQLAAEASTWLTAPAATPEPVQ